MKTIPLKRIKSVKEGFRRRHSLGGRLLRFYLPLICLSLALVFTVLLWRNYQALMDNLRADLQQFAVMQATALATPLWRRDTMHLELLVHVMVSNPNVHSLQVTDQSGAPLAAYGLEGENENIADPGLSVRVPIVFSRPRITRQVGELLVTFHAEGVRKTIRDDVITDTIALVALMVILTLTTLLITRRFISEPIEKLHGSITAMQNGDKPEPVLLDADNELGELVHAYNEMQMQQSETENRLRDFARATSDCFWEMDKDLRFTYFYIQKGEFIGIDPSAYIGKTREEVTSSKIDDPHWQKHFEDLRNHREFRDFRHDLLDKNGKTVTVSVSGIPFFDDTGEFQGYRGVTANVTDQETVERALKLKSREVLENEIHLRQSAQLSKVGYWVWDEINDRAVSCSEGCAEIHGVTVEEFLAHSASMEKDYEWVHPDDLPKYKAVMDSLDKNIGSVEIVYRLINSDGDIRYVRDIIEPVFDEQWQHIRSFGAIQDITDQKCAELALMAAKEESERANHAKSQFLAHMSHELRTPLNAIIGFSQIMSEEVFGKIGVERYREYINDIQTSGLHLLSLINDVLDLSKVEVGELILEETAVDLNEIIPTAIRMVRGRLEATGISINFNPTPGLAKIRADERLLRQIMLNLLSNAVKYNKKDGAVDVAAHINGSGAINVSISDTGIGIAEQDIPRVLEPFVQVRSSAHITVEGTGLGLSLSKQLVALHGGELKLVSSLGEGTTVTVVLPADRVLAN